MTFNLEKLAADRSRATSAHLSEYCRTLDTKMFPNAVRAQARLQHGVELARLLDVHRAEIVHMNSVLRYV